MLDWIRFGNFGSEYDFGFENTCIQINHCIFSKWKCMLGDASSPAEVHSYKNRHFCIFDIISIPIFVRMVSCYGKHTVVAFWSLLWVIVKLEFNFNLKALFASLSKHYLNSKWTCIWNILWSCLKQLLET